ncbi:putative short-chain dehydrogenase [Polyplosphaeria fusca]|uniref:3beta-hydroxysteroid 3-dehydrogenase n=1 Tax=Polyplosphaeria fusca TaxID=682080 RepID=A0A9P4QSP8_9PLEO|nr:putative short-chain dehydrogenase [Polyplosphaeria fusca]
MASARGTIFITGANGGLGSALVSHITSSPELSSYHGIYTVRDADNAPVVGSALTNNSFSHTSDVVSLDLTNLDSVRQTAHATNTRVSNQEIPPIRALILNAGFQDWGHQTWTADGYDTTFSANYLGQWLLSLLLLKSMDKDKGRIIILGSQSHDPYDPRNTATGAFNDKKYKLFIDDETSLGKIASGTWSSAKEDPSWRSGFRRYGAAKLFLVMMVHELQQRMTHEPVLKNISVLGVDPGTMSTGMQRQASWFIRVFIFRLLYPLLAWIRPPGPARSTGQSASDVLQAAFDSNETLGEFPRDVYLDGTRLFEPSAESKDVKKRALVWKQTVEMAGLKPNDTILKSYL